MCPRDDFDHYPTPIELCRAALRESWWAKNPRAKLRILDPGAGTGVWGEVAREIWPDAEIHGIELRDEPRHPAYDVWEQGNYMLKGYPRPFDFIIGNPPFGDPWEQQQLKLSREAQRVGLKHKRPDRPGDGPMAGAEAFCRKAIRLDTMDGNVAFLLRLAFLEGQNRSAFFWPDHIPHSVLTLSRRPSFTGNGKTDATAYAMYYWHTNLRQPRYLGGWLKW